MSALANQASRIAWLMANLTGKREHIRGLLRRLSGLGNVAALKPALFRKFLHMLDEVAAAKRVETGLISRIEAMERRHRAMRLLKNLKKAGPRPALPAQDPLLLAALKPEPSRPARSRLWLFVIWYFVLRQGINQKKQRLTVD